MALCPSFPHPTLLFPLGCQKGVESFKMRTIQSWNPTRPFHPLVPISLIAERPPPYLTPNHEIVLKSMGSNGSSPWPVTPSPSPIYYAQAFELVMANKAGKKSLKDESPHHPSNGNLTLLPFPIVKWTLLLKIPHLFLIVFHNPTPLAHQSTKSNP